MGEYEAKISVKNFAKEWTNICYVNLILRYAYMTL